MQFLTVSDAIRVLRRGTKDEQWFDAASFLIDRASPEVKLMLEVGRELEKRERLNDRQGRKSYVIKPWLLIFLGTAVLAISAGYIGWQITRSIGVIC